MIIDAHVHVGAWDHPDFLARAADLPTTLADLAGAGVEGALLMSTDRCENAELLAAASSSPFPGPLWMLAWVRPGTPDLDWVEKHAGALTGIKLHPSLSRFRVTDAEFAPALELAAAKDLLVLVHCGRWQEMASYRFALDAAAAHPGVRFLLAHAGGDTPPLATAAAEMVVERKLENVWFDFAGLREYWVIERNVARLGADRYLFGSDYNLAHPGMYIGAVRGMALSDADRERILGGNARALLGAPLERR